MDLLVAVDENFGIGLNNEMPWRIKGEQIFFKEKTINGIVVMGRKCFESLPNQKPLANRENVILTRNKNYKPEGTTVFNDLESILTYLKEKDNVHIIGGTQIYTLFLPYCEKAYITKIKKTYTVDTYFPNLDKMDNWSLNIISEDIKTKKGLVYNRCEYLNSTRLIQAI